MTSSRHVQWVKGVSSRKKSPVELGLAFKVTFWPAFSFLWKIHGFACAIHPADPGLNPSFSYFYWYFYLSWEVIICKGGRGWPICFNFKLDLKIIHTYNLFSSTDVKCFSVYKLNVAFVMLWLLDFAYYCLNLNLRKHRNKDPERLKQRKVN